MDFFIIPAALAMDAFAVSIGIGIYLISVTKKQILNVSFHFGFFQFIMPIIGYFLAKSFSRYIQNFDHWIAFVLLVYIGINMIIESKDDCCKKTDPTKEKNLIILSIATSIDAMAIGIAFAALGKNIFIPAVSTGIITFIMSFIGVYGGCFLGKKFGKLMEIFGGIVLIIIGSKILIEHLFF
ncbi:MAG TPA: manganese efflux pump MntP family protein [Tepiditoga sp.]|nr:manganese efflux pump [Thermotogota bacterium]HOO73814.1 manganese efflux pump MntP family protein [Tepiditoga sp.]